jgi:site-specific DNA-cytosine methylase
MKGTIPAAQQGGPAWTIKATAKELGGDRIVMPGGETYTLTPRAYARLLGLPDEYPLPDDARLAKTIVGNAMAPAMTREVMEPFLKMLAGKGVQ